MVTRSLPLAVFAIASARLVTVGVVFSVFAGAAVAEDEAPATATVEALDYRELYPDLVTPGNFHAVTLPRGVSRLRVASEYFTESYFTEEEDERGLTRVLPADDFYEWGSAISWTYGITQSFEVGVLLPYVYSSFNKSAADDFSDLPQHASEDGLGNIVLSFGSGMSWNDESDLLLVELGLGLPTDTRSNDLFATGGSVGGRLTYEHYWDRFGLVGEIFTDYFGEDQYKGGEWSYGYRAGIGLEPMDGLYFSWLAGHRDDGDFSSEAFLEVMITREASVELFGGLDLSGDDDEKFIGLGLNVLVGN